MDKSKKFNDDKQFKSKFGIKSNKTKTADDSPQKFKKQFNKKFGGDKTNSQNRDKRTIGGKPKKPGGRGAHPVYGVKAQSEKNEDDGKFHKVRSGKVQKRGKGTRKR